MKLLNGSEVTARLYRDKDAEAIVNLIRRNFLEVNVKDYGEEAINELNGIGRYIIETLEQDELFLRADRVEIPASITAVEFYKKQGYDYKNGVKELDDEGHFRLEKFNIKREEV